MKIRQAVKKAFDDFERIPEKQSGFLGRADGTVRVPGKRHWLYVRLWNGNIVEAYNQNVPANFGLAVDVVYRNGQYFVQARQVYQDVVNTSVPDGLEDELQWPNSHTMYVRPEQFLAGLVYPKSGMTVYVYGGMVPLPGGGYIEVPSSELDLTPYLPASGAIWAVVSLDEDGEIGVTMGGAADNWQLLDKAEIPSVTDGYALFAIRLFKGQTSLQHGKFGSMLEDLRWIRTGGGGSITLPSDKVITTNDSGRISDNSPRWYDTAQRIEIGPDAPTLPYLSGETGIKVVGTSPGQTMVSVGAIAAKFNFIRAEGTLGALSPVTVGRLLGYIPFGGVSAVNGGNIPEVDTFAAGFAARTTENWTTAGRGAKVQIYATPTGTNSEAVVAEFAGNRIDLLQPTYAPTPDPSTNNTQLATTAFVNAEINNARPYSNTNPLMNGTVAQGSSARVSRQDHVHPTDTSRAPLASPTFTGVPAAPTAAAGTNTTQIATTAFVQESKNTTLFLLPFSSYNALGSPISASPAFPYAATFPSFTIYPKRWSQGFFIGAINDASNYWIFDLIATVSGTDTVIATITTVGLATTSAGIKTTTTFSQASFTQINIRFAIRATKIGNPSNVSAHGPALEYALA